MNTPTGYSALDLVGFTDRGDYSSSETYVKNDLVHYLGDIWRVKLDDITGQTPSEGTYYTIFIEGIPDKAYKTDDTTENTLASDDVLPFYDTSASAKRKMPVQKFAEQLISNPNLLDNPWFTVNQRGQSSYTANSRNAYTVDRWMFKNTEVTVNSNNGITVDNSTDATAYGSQRLENDVKTQLLGRTVTLSAIIDDVLYSASGIVPSPLPNGTTIVHIGKQDVLTIRLRTDGTSGILSCDFVLSSGESATVKAVKLELGSVSTLAMDTAPNYQQELAKCMRYFVRLHHESIGTGIIAAANTCACVVTVPVPMRAIPSLTLNGSIGVGIDDGTFGSITSITSWNDNGVTCVGFSGIGVTHAAGSAIRLYLINNNSLDISADL
jgi:hypothetical protein